MKRFYPKSICQKLRCSTATFFFKKELVFSSHGYKSAMKTYVYVAGFLLYVQSRAVWHTTNPTWHKYQQSIAPTVKSVAAYGQYLIQKLTGL
jgi:hypothetical protein